VRLAYVFGSHAAGKVTRFSDVDIAVLFEESVEKDVDGLRAAIVEAVEDEAVDLVDLGSAPPGLAYRIVSEGRLVLGEEERPWFERDVMERYFDFRPLEQRYFGKMYERLEEGTYAH